MNAHHFTIKLLMNWKAQELRTKFIWVCYLSEFIIYVTWVSKFSISSAAHTFVKTVSQAEEAKYNIGLMSLRLWLQYKVDFVLFGRKLPIKLLIYKWYKLFDYTSYICWTFTEAQVNKVQGTLIHSSSKSVIKQTMLSAWQTRCIIFCRKVWNLKVIGTNYCNM
jgi:hypothetical protein